MTDPIRVGIIGQDPETANVLRARRNEDLLVVEAHSATLSKFEPAPDVILAKASMRGEEAQCIVTFTRRPDFHIPLVAYGALGNGEAPDHTIIDAADAWVPELEGAALHGAIARVIELYRLRDEKRRIESVLRYRLEFEALLTRLSTRFIHSSATEIDDAITWALRQIGVFTKVDRCFAFQFFGDENVHFTHEYVAPGFESTRLRYAVVSMDLFPWAIEQYRRFQFVYVSDVDDLPKEAWQEQQLWRNTSVKSVLAVPLSIGKELLGVLGLTTERYKKTWVQEDIRLLEAAAQMLANAITRQRTDAALHRMERQVLEISAREQMRIGQDLHDGLGQQLTGIGFKGQLLARDLAEKGLPEATTASALVEMVSDAISQTRSLARGLYPVHLEADGLMTALQELAAQTQSLYGIPCRFFCEEPILLYDRAVTTHLYRIAQEALNNAVRHGKATAIEIELLEEGEAVSLSIRDNGVGMPSDAPPHKGLGLSIMRYRARMIEGTLEVGPAASGGTAVTCRFKVPETPA